MIGFFNTDKVLTTVEVIVKSFDGLMYIGKKCETNHCDCTDVRGCSV